MDLRKRIFLRVIGLLTLLIVAICAAASAFTIAGHRESTKKLFKEHSLSFANQAGRLFLWDDRVALKGLLVRLVGDHPYIDYAFVESEGRPYVHTFHTGVPKALLALHGAIGETPSLKEFKNGQGRIFFDVAAEMGKGEAVLHIGLSRDNIDLAAYANVLTICVLGIAALVAGILFAGVTAGVTTREVDGTTAALRRAHDTLEARVEERTRHLEREISEREQAEKALRKSEEQYRSVAESASDAIIVIDGEGDVVSWNRQAGRIFGYSEDEMLGEPLSKIIPERHREAHESHMRHMAGKDEPNLPARTMELHGLSRDGSEFPIELSLGSWSSGDQKFFSGIIRDITQRKIDEEIIIRKANYDTLTGLPNRGLFIDRLSRALVRARRSGEMVALAYIDLDGFKKVNDTLGHAAGDEMLKEAARRLVSCVRESDTVARLGGDEFTVILSGIQKFQETELVARKVLKSLSRFFMLRGSEVFTTASIGITVFPGDADDGENLLMNADTAMYHAKEDGNTFRFFTERMNAEALEHMKLEGDLRHALDRGEFVLHYQPITDLRSWEVTGAEALLRWNHPMRGLMMPDDFIPLAEDTGLIVPIGEWVLDSACGQLMAWREEGLPPLRMAVNLTARQCGEATLVDMVEQTLRKHRVAPASLTLEITESVFMAEGEGKAASVLGELRKMGIGLALDDFGTGYSSLIHLKRFPVDILKLDYAFMTDVGKDTGDKSLIEAIIALAHGLGLKVVGEGAETLEQVDVLRSRECDYIQGFYFSEPLPTAEFTAFVASAPRLPHRLKS